MRRAVKAGVVAGAVAAAAGVGAFAWYVIDDDAPPPPSLEAAAGGEAGGDGGAAEAVEVGDLSGEWTVVAGGEVTEDGTYVGYRVDEVLAGVHRTAVGRSPAVTGSLTVEGTTVTAASFTADLTRLQSDDSRRDGRIHSLGLESERYPETTFTLAEPIELDPSAATIEATAVGDLTLHGVTRRVELPLSARLRADGTAVVVGTLEVRFADFGIEKPDIGGFVTTEDHGTIEVQLVVERAA